MSERPMSWDCKHPTKAKNEANETTCTACGCKFLFNLSFIASNGLRTLMGPAQGHRMHATREAAEEYLKAVVSSNSEELLASVYGKQAIGTFRVDEFECWSHGDPKGIYVDEEGAS